MVIGNNNIIEAVDSILDSTQDKDCHLSIFRYEGGLSFCVLRKDINKFILLADYIAHDAIEAASHLDQFEGDYDTVTLIESRPSGVFVPEVLFDETRKSEWLNQSTLNYVSSDSIQVEKIHSAKAVFLSNSHSQLSSHVNRLFKNVNVMSSQAVFTEGVLGESRYKPGHKIYASITGKTISLVYVNEGKLQLSNQFVLTSEQDISYYILAVIDQYGLKPDEVEVVFSGDIEMTKAGEKLISGYGVKAMFEPYPSQYKYSSSFSQIPPHAFFINFISHSCAS